MVRIGFGMYILLRVPGPKAPKPCNVGALMIRIMFWGYFIV